MTNGAYFFLLALIAVPGAGFGLGLYENWPIVWLSCALFVVGAILFALWILSLEGGSE